MFRINNYKNPEALIKIKEATELSGFSMASDELLGSFLRVLARTKRNSDFLELGTGTGLSTSWILNGMDSESRLISIDNDKSCQKIAYENLKEDRLTLICKDAGEWIEENGDKKFDFIFADTWHGKYLLLENTLKMLNKGGIYIVDDMIPQENWPEGHHEKAERLATQLENHEGILLTKLNWTSGIIICTKI